MMIIKKHVVRDAARIPLIAALPYEITLEMSDTDPGYSYDPTTQLSAFAGRRDFSTSRYDESAGGLFTSKSDTKKDD